MKRAIVLLITTLCLVVSHLGFSTVIPVANTNDNGPGSLRYAISFALAGDTVQMDTSIVSGSNDTIYLDSVIDILQPITILGMMTPTDTIVVSGQNQSGIFSANFPNSSMSYLRVENLYLVKASNVDSGGALHCQGVDSLFINQCVFKENTSFLRGGAVHHDGSFLKISNSIVDFNSSLVGGGVFTHSAGTFKCDSSLFRGNSAGLGGAIFSHKMLYLFRCRLNGNSAVNDGGAIYATLDLNAVRNEVSLIETNLDSNFVAESGGALYYSGGYNADSCFLRIKKCSVSKNNSSDTWPGVEFKVVYGGGSAAPIKYILVDVDSSVFNNNTSQMGGALRVFTPNAENQTLELNIKNSDFIGNLQLQAAQVVQADIFGYVSSNQLNAFIQNSNFLNNQDSTNISNLSGSTAIWLRSHNTTLNGDHILADGNRTAIFAYGFHNNNVTLANCTIQNNSNRGVYTESDSINNVTIRNSLITTSTPGIELGETLLTTGQPSATINAKFVNSTLSFNSTSGINYGAGIGSGLNLVANVLLDSGTSIYGNNTDYDGGAISIVSEDSINLKVLNGSSITNNYAEDHGGGMHLVADRINAELNDATVSSNHCDGDGGAFYIESTQDSGKVEFINSVIDSNTAIDHGGVVYSQSALGVVRFKNSIVRHNRSISGHGGVVMHFYYLGYKGITEITDSSYFYGNYASDVAGVSYLGKFIVSNGSVMDSNSAYKAALSHGNTVLIKDSEVKNNYSQSLGGVLGLVANLTIKNSMIHHNQSLQSYAGVACSSGAQILTIEDSWIYENSAAEEGGAFVISGISNIKNTTFSKNSSGESGGALYLLDAGAIANLTNCTFYQNSANERGGGVFLGGTSNVNPVTSINFKNCTLLDNTSTLQGKDFASYSSSNIFAAGIDVNFQGTIIANSSLHSISMTHGNLTSLGRNLFTQNVTQAIQSDFNAVPYSIANLDTLNNNGGFAPTALPLSYSPAVNNGDPSDSSLAQNGALYLTRDIGSAESQFCEHFKHVQVTACDSFQQYPSGPINYNSVTSLDTFPNAQGCDSIVNFELIVNNTVYSEATIQVCSPFTWAVTGITYDSSGSYFDTTLAANGCYKYSQLHLTVNYISVDIKRDTISSDSISLMALDSTGDSYQWLDCLDNYAPIPGETDPIFTSSSGGLYALKVYKGSCSEQSVCYTLPPLSTNETPVSNILVYPNPTSRLIHIENITPASSMSRLIIQTMQGQNIVDYVFNSPAIEYQFMEPCSGIYLLMIVSNEQILYKEKIILVKE